MEVLNGQTVNHANGSTWEKSACEQCSCVGGAVFCTVLDCPEVNPLCTNIDTSGCCSVCKDGTAETDISSNRNIIDLYYVCCCQTVLAV